MKQQNNCVCIRNSHGDEFYLNAMGDLEIRKETGCALYVHSQDLKKLSDFILECIERNKDLHAAMPELPYEAEA